MTVQTLPEAVLTHLDVLGLPVGPVKIHATKTGERWTYMDREPIFTQELAEDYQRAGVDAMELRVAGNGISEFHISELVR